MRGRSLLKYVLAGVALVAVLAAGYASVGYSGRAQAASSGPTDTEPPPATTPAPDPAPPPPKPKPPAPKPPPKPTPPAPKPAPVYHPPAAVQHTTPAPAPQPTYTPPPVVRHVTKKKVVHHRAHKRVQHKRVQHVVTTPKVQTPAKAPAVVKVSGVPTAAVTTTNSDAIRRTLIIAGMGIAALLFFLVFAVPATGVRFTAPGRVLMDHQMDLVLVGVAILVVTVLLFAMTGTG